MNQAATDTLAEQDDTLIPKVDGKVNVEDDQLLENVRANIRKPVAQFFRGDPRFDEICIVGGGWSLNEPDVYQELCDLYHRGAKIIALNGAGRWCMEKNLRPSCLIMCDARSTDENRNFVDIEIPNCRYLIASQVDPSVFDIAQKRGGDMMSVFHAVNSFDSDIGKELNGWYGEGRWIPVPAIGFVGLTAFYMMAIAGYLRQHIFGLDGCYNGEQHHAYEQKQNDGEMMFNISVAGREFVCSPWMVAQAQLFTDGFMKHLSDRVHLAFHGDGLLAHIIRTGAEIELKE